MNRKQQTPLIVLTALAAAGLLIVLGAWAVTVRTVAADVASLRVDHQLIGEVELEWGTTGVFSDSNAIVAPTVIPTSTVSDLGDIALALLVQSDVAGTDGYVDLEHTLVFTGEHTVDVTVGLSTTQGVMTGPSVSGSYGNGSMLLVSEKYTHTTQAEQVVQRQFWLSGTISNSLATGEYRETIWGYGLDPVTIVGNFEMAVIDSPSTVPTSVSTTGFGATAQAVGLSIVAMVLGLIVVTGSAARHFRPKPQL